MGVKVRATREQGKCCSCVLRADRLVGIENVNSVIPKSCIRWLFCIFHIISFIVPLSFLLPYSIHKVIVKCLKNNKMQSACILGRPT